MEELVDLYYQDLGKGCIHTIKQFFLGRVTDVPIRIAQAAGLEAMDVVKLLSSVNMICIGSADKDEAEAKLYHLFMDNTDGGKGTGYRQIDLKIEKYALLAKLALNSNWKARERRIQQKNSP